MIPIRDINPTRITPAVNYTLVALNVVAFFWVQSMPPWYEAAYGLVPTRLTGDPLGESFTIFTSMFMHANLAHLGGNMLFLYIFGDNVEDALGHFRYLLFYLLSGVAAGLSQVGMEASSAVPMVGASGAIAGVTAAYVMLYPRAPIMVLNPFFPLWFLVGPFFMLPAWIVAGEFFLMNLYMGLRSLGMEVSGGVAVFAHLGGFVAGLALIRPMMRGRGRNKRDRWSGWRPPGPPRAGGGRGQGPRRDPWIPPRYH